MSVPLLTQLKRALLELARSLPQWLRRDFIWTLLAIPCLFLVVMYSLSRTDVLGWQDTSVCKQAMEILHPSLLAAATLISLAGWIRRRDAALAFLGILCAAALTRELLGQGSSFVFIFVLLSLITYGGGNRESIATLLQSPWATSLLGMCFVCYIASQLLDRGVIKRIGWLILFDTSWRPPYASNLEEGLETLGGLFLLIAAVFLLVLAGKKRDGVG